MSRIDVRSNKPRARYKSEEGTFPSFVFSGTGIYHPEPEFWMFIHRMDNSGVRLVFNEEEAKAIHKQFGDYLAGLAETRRKQMLQAEGHSEFCRRLTGSQYACTCTARR